MDPSSGVRVIVLVDMDCFYVQVEEKLCPEYKNKPCAVVQYKVWKGGGIIAVNYEARAKGVTRMLRGDDAVKLCPDIHLFRVPEVRGKADLTRYREAGAKVLDVLCEFSDCVERASIDEAYLDMTAVINSRLQSAPPVTADQLPNSFVVGWENEDPETRKIELQKWLEMIYEEEHLYNDRMLAVAAVIVEEMRAAVYENTGYRCSAGIAHNKMLAKLSCGIHKPNKQTILPQSSIQLLYNTISVKKVRNLGGKFGELVMKKLNAQKMGDLFHVPKSQLVSSFGEKNGNWLYDLARGIENEPVTARQLPKSIGCGKNFPSKTSLNTKDKITHWLKQLSIELAERLVKDQESNKRVARQLTISLRNHGNKVSTLSRSCPIHVYDADILAYDAFSAIKRLNTSTSENIWQPSIWALSMAASKFEDKLDNSYCNIESYLLNRKYKEVPQTELADTVENQIDTKCNDNVQEQNSMLEDCCDAIDMLENDSVSSTDLSHVHFKLPSPKQNDNNSAVEKQTNSHESTVGKQTNQKMGFFAKKLAQRSEFCFDIDFKDKSCVSINSMDESDLTDEGQDLIDTITTISMLSTSTKTNNLNNNDILPSTSDNFGNNNLPSTSIENDAQSVAVNSYFDNDFSNLDPELTKLCDKCNRRIPIWEEEEHLDYHMALDLSKEDSVKPTINRTAVNSASTTGKSLSTKSKHGRKRGNLTKLSGSSKKIPVQSNTLDAFLNINTM